jgi:hypothetical protein
MRETRTRDRAFAWVLFGAGTLLLCAGVWLITAAVPSMMERGYAGRNTHLSEAALLFLGAFGCLQGFVRRLRAGAGATQAVTRPPLARRLSLRARLWLIWSWTGMAVVMIAWSVFMVQCPAWRSLDKLGLLGPARVMPSVHGEARCWLVFSVPSLVIVVFGTAMHLVVSRRGQREGAV